MSVILVLGEFFSYIALAIGIGFFFFASKYYFSIIIALFFGKNSEKYNIEDTKYSIGVDESDIKQVEIQFKSNEPFISIQLPFYNEINVAARIIRACIDIDYTNYEILVTDDSRDETINILKELSRRPTEPAVKVIHRKDRSGFKGGALQKAVEYMNPRTEYIVVFDADFIPPPDILRRFLWYFEGSVGRSYHRDNNHRFGDDVVSHYISSDKTNEDELLERVDQWYKKSRIGVVQGYQLHHLNKKENWITKGIRAEFSGGYMIERVSEEFFGALKMIAGSVFMIRADIVKKLGWTHSITEDWDLTLRMYMDGYKVLYTPLIQAPAEIPKTIRAVSKQRMRWAEGHTFAVKKYFWDVLGSPNLSFREKLEFLYFSPYYLQSFFFLIGTIFWFISELIGRHPYFWSPVFGWSLILSNFLALPLMSLTGLYLERSAREDVTGVFYMIILSYVLAPFQAYAAIKGLFERDEGEWVRTFKTGSITDRILQIRLRRIFSWIIPHREPSIRRGSTANDEGGSMMVNIIILIVMSSFIAWITVSAVSIPDDGPLNTFLTLEYVPQKIEINGVSVNRILTHEDASSLGYQKRIDGFDVCDEWKKAWEFYLLNPLETAHKIKVRLNTMLYLYGDDEGEVIVEIRVSEIDLFGKKKNILRSNAFVVKLFDDVPDEPYYFHIDTRKANSIDEGSRVVMEIWLKAFDGGPSKVNLAYGSASTHSRIDFQSVVMPESLLFFIIAAPCIPVVIYCIQNLHVSDHQQRFSKEV